MQGYFMRVWDLLHLCVQSVLTIKGAFVQAMYTCLDGVLRKKKVLVAEYRHHAVHRHKQFYTT